MVSASPRSICALVEPAAPKARRQNCNRAEAVLALLRIKSSANSRSSGLGLSSRTSSPLTIAPTGLIRSWQTREHNSAARSSASGAGAGPGDEVPDIESSWKAAHRGRLRITHAGWFDTLRKPALPARGGDAKGMSREHEQDMRHAYE